MDLYEMAEKLGEHREHMLEVVGEIKDLFRALPRDGMIRARAESYWLAQIEIALSKDHGYLAGSMCDMEDTIKEIEAAADGEPKEEEEEDDVEE